MNALFCTFMLIRYFCNNDVAFQCGDTSCLSERLVCDGHVDCVDGADERNCSQIYKTCDDIWRDGLTKDGIYTIGEGFKVRCTFNRTTGFITMKFLTSDWRRYSNTNTFSVDPPSNSVINDATQHGYICSQKYFERFKRGKERVMAFDNEFSNETITSSGERIRYLNIFRRQELFCII
ncbi:complement component C9-like [Ruditapes philippinarum]|uniref:complement component C9-like n=1 Tax=Ruditapes philippinarum TaxID=129788 RepID=UPI00295C38C6|nr:complement component C9-like [Ruditapes philippinarum]